MTRLVCEGLRVRIDDVWAGENNGKEYYLDLNAFTGELPSLPEEMTYEDLELLRLSFALNGCKDYAGEIKDQVIEATLQLLEKQAEKGNKPKGKVPKLISEMTGISENYIREYYRCRNLRVKNIVESEDVLEKKKARQAMKSLRRYMRFLLEHLDTYEWTELMSSLDTERELADELIDKLQKTIIEGDEKMKKMTVEYLLEDSQAEYLGRIHKHYSRVSEEDLFLMIMIEGSAPEISRKMQAFCEEHQIDNSFTYEA